jgi:hypothetical protein
MAGVGEIKLQGKNGEENGKKIFLRRVLRIKRHRGDGIFMPPE